jgi:hypothetical protein
MRLEVVVIPVADAARAELAYEGLGWREDADLAKGPDFRVVQFTPPGSACSIIFGTGLTTAAPGSTQGLQLVAADIDAARAELAGYGVAVSEVSTMPAGYSTTPGRTGGLRARRPSTRPTARSSRSATRTATSGSSRRSPRAFRAGDPARRRRSQGGAAPRYGTREGPMAVTHWYVPQRADGQAEGA